MKFKLFADLPAFNKCLSDVLILIQLLKDVIRSEPREKTRDPRKGENLMQAKD